MIPLLELAKSCPDVSVSVRLGDDVIAHEFFKERVVLYTDKIRYFVGFCNFNNIVWSEFYCRSPVERQIEFLVGGVGIAVKFNSVLRGENRGAREERLRTDRRYNDSLH